jgi:hypothetical protein
LVGAPTKENGYSFQNKENNMATIQELIDDGQVELGKTKIRIVNGIYWIIPVFLSESGGSYIGVNQAGTGVVFGHHVKDFEVWQEPVEMEDRWLWAVVRKVFSRPVITSYFYSSEEDYRKTNTECAQLIRLDYTKQSFPKRKK